MMVVHLEAEGLNSEPKRKIVTAMPTDQKLRVRIYGPTEVRADRSYKYTAVVTQCSETESVDDLKLKV